MSTTVARPRSARFPGRKTGMAIVGLGLAAAIGYGIANTGEEPAPTQAVSQASTADRVITNRATELATQRQNLLNSATKGAGPGVVAQPQAGVQPLADQLALSATTHVGADVWDDYLNSTAASQGASTEQQTPTFGGQTGPR